MEREIELALEPDNFIPDRASFSHVSGLERIAAAIAKLIRSDPRRAVGLFEAFLAGCQEKAEEVDDSSGSFGQFVQGLFCEWIKARQGSGADPDETATRLLSFMDRDTYGFSNGLEKEAAKALDKAGLAALELKVRVRFEAAATAKSPTDGSLRSDPDCPRRRWGGVLRSVYLAQRDVAAYVALSERTGLTAQDCQAIATLLVARRKPQDALDWVERGLGIEKQTPQYGFAGHELAKLRRVLLSKLGRGGEALDLAWAEFRKRPSRFAYDDLMKFAPKSERAVWHENAMGALEGTNIGSAIELLLGTKELERLANLVRRTTDGELQCESHYVTEPAAKKLEKRHPDLAARLWRAQGMRIVDAKKSKYYDAALSNFERAKSLFGKAGLAAEWAKTVSDVRTRHRLKTGFMPDFEKLVAGSPPSEKPSFLERAKKRWGGLEKEIS